MKKAISPTNHEIKMLDDDFIVSKTDPKGRITYANRIFMRISGYAEKELLGIQHNIVRHPDMPRGIFHLMWQTLKSQNEFFGYIKNITLQGDYYWTFANVTPSININGQLTGYYSVRRKPKDSAVAILSDFYLKMLREERAAGPKNAVDASLPLLNNFIAQQGHDYNQFIFAL